MSTLGEQWMQEGMQKGLQQGMEIGRQETAVMMTLRLLRHRFGDLDQRTQTSISELSFEQLEQLTDALLDFKSTEELTAWLGTQ